MNRRRGEKKSMFSFSFPFFTDIEITQRQIDYQDAQRGIDAYNNLSQNGILSLMHKDDRVRHKKAFVENLKVKNEIFREFRGTRKDVQKYNEHAFGKKNIELRFWDETVSC